MTRKPDAQEPLLNTVARKLGHAAGTLANMTHLLTKEQTTGASGTLLGPGSDQPESGRSSVKNESSPVTVDRKQSRGQSQKRKRSARARMASPRNAASGTKRASSKKGPQAR